MGVNVVVSSNSVFISVEILIVTALSKELKELRIVVEIL